MRDGGRCRPRAASGIVSFAINVAEKRVALLQIAAQEIVVLENRAWGPIKGELYTVLPQNC